MLNEPSQTLPRGEEYEDKFAAKEGASSDEEDRYRGTCTRLRAPTNEDSDWEGFAHSSILFSRNYRCPLHHA